MNRGSSSSLFFQSLKAQLHLPDCIHMTLLRHLRVGKQKLSRVQHGGHKCTNSQDVHWSSFTFEFKTWAQSWKAAINHILINLFSLNTFPRCPKVLHKEVMVTCPTCFDQKTGKKGKTSMWSWKQTHIQRHYNSWLVCWGQFWFSIHPSDLSKSSQMYHLNLLKFLLRF